MEIINVPNIRQIVKNYIDNNVNLFQLNEGMNISQSIIDYAAGRGYEYRFDEWTRMHQFRKRELYQEQEQS